MTVPRRIGQILAVLIVSVGSGGAVPASVVRYQAKANRDIVIVAHQDDWQLFMGDLIAPRAAAGDSITFVYLTAGDDGRDSVYWLTRERAALSSTRVLAGSSATLPVAGCGSALVRTHSIRRCVVGTTVSWFLRLPDGRRNGAGFARYGKQSLRKLRRKSIGSVTAVDGSAVYQGWPDLVATVGELIAADKASGPTALHTTDPSIAINPHDHFDHRMAGLLTRDVGTGHDWKVWYYVGYALGTRAANRSTSQARTKTSLFRAYDDVIVKVNPKWSAYAEHPMFYSECMLRTYARLAPAR